MSPSSMALLSMKYLSADLEAKQLHKPLSALDVEKQCVHLELEKINLELATLHINWDRRDVKLDALRTELAKVKEDNRVALEE